MVGVYKSVEFQRARLKIGPSEKKSNFRIGPNEPVGNSKSNNFRVGRGRKLKIIG